jgi:molybdopterin synthase catalytic subunit
MFEITKDSISFQKTINKVKCRKEGSIITFIGTVGEFTKSEKTVHMQYAVNEELAIKKLSQIGAEVQEKWPETVVAITLRIGKLEISDIAVVIVVSSPHRNLSFVASRFALDNIKKVVLKCSNRPLNDE